MRTTAIKGEEPALTGAARTTTHHLSPTTPTATSNKALDHRSQPCQVNRMQIYGIDFTSRPKRSKPIACLACTLECKHLIANDLTEWRGFDGFEEILERPGPWIAGMDFPFGQARRFIETIGWPNTWQGYVDHVAQMTRAEFREALDAYRKPREQGDKEHRRRTDSAAGSISPQKLYGRVYFVGSQRAASPDRARHLPSAGRFRSPINV